MSRMIMPKLDAREVYGDYEVIRTINTDRPGMGVPVIILAALDADNPMLYQVRRKSTVIQFATYREMQDYCKRYGWME